MKEVMFQVRCEVCQWHSPWLSTVKEVQRAAKLHHQDEPHRDYQDVPLFE